MNTELLPFESHDVQPAQSIPLARLNAIRLLSAWHGEKKPATIRGYAEDLRHFARYLEIPDGDVIPMLERLVTLDASLANTLVLEYKNKQLAPPRPLASATIARRLAAIRSIVKLARTLGLVNWSIEIPAPRAEKRRVMKGPDADGLKRIKRVLRDCSKRDQAIFALLYGMGLRRAEVVGLDLVDVDFAAATLTVLRKGKREKQTKTLWPQVQNVLGAWVLERGPAPGPLFHRQDGARGTQRLHLSSLNNVLDRIGKRAKLPGKLRPHGCRHAAITGLFRRGKTVLEVQAWADHEKPETTLLYYDEMKDSIGETGRDVANTLD
jgi:integrase/recombinase XerC